MLLKTKTLFIYSLIKKGSMTSLGIERVGVI
jgi:hypothetical protein